MNEEVSASKYLVGLEEAAKIAAENPCLNCGLFFEIRPTELAHASAYAVTTETPMGAKINNRRMSRKYRNPRNACSLPGTLDRAVL